MPIDRRRARAGFLRRAALLLLLATIAIAPRSGGALGEASPPPSPDVASLASRPEVARALALVVERRDVLIEDWVRIASTPASSGKEEARAALVEAALREAGLESVGRDERGNVLGLIPGRDRSSKRTVLMAHMDTVARPGDDVSVRNDGAALRGPGVRDDSSGVAAIVAAARIVREAGVTPPADVWIVASVEEEVGLRGARHFMDRFGDQVGAFVGVDGYLGQISYGATGIVWTKMHFRAPGAHTLRSYENPSATLAAARAIEGIYAIKVPREPETIESWINVGMLGGGEVPNAQARDAWFTVDLRSNDPATIGSLEKEILEACRRAAAEVGVAFEAETLQRLEGSRFEGRRDALIVQTARAVLEHLGWKEISLTPRGAGDHNLAVLMEIPTVAVGVTTGDRAHTPQEYAEIAPYEIGLKQIILLIASPLREAGAVGASGGRSDGPP